MFMMAFATMLLTASSTNLAEILQERWAMSDSPGLVAWSGDHLNGICASGNVGWAQEIGQDPTFSMDGRMSFGSLTKAMTVTLSGIVISQGRIIGQNSDDGWDTTLADIFPSSAGTPYQNVDLRMLASNFGGLPAELPGLGDLGFFAFDIPNQSLRKQRANITMTALQTTPAVSPGTGFVASNLGFIILGHILEESLNMTWEDAMMKYLITPLGMDEGDWPFGAPTGSDAIWGHFDNNTACDPHNPPSAYTDVIPSYACDNAANVGPAATYAGRIVSTSRYYFWLSGCSQGLLNNAIALTQKDCLNMLQPYGSMGNGTHLQYGYGWIIDDTQDGVQFFHMGSNQLNLLWVSFSPEFGQVHFAATNRNTEADRDLIDSLTPVLLSFSCDSATSLPGWEPDNHWSQFIIFIAIVCSVVFGSGILFQCFLPKRRHDPLDALLDADYVYDDILQPAASTQTGPAAQFDNLNNPS